MKFWRKRSDGFEWHKHVRTTIKLRREDRRRRIEAVKVAAVDGIKEAGRAGVAAGSSGLVLAGEGAKSASAATMSAFQRFAHAVRAECARFLSAAKAGTVRVSIAAWRRMVRFAGATRAGIGRLSIRIADTTVRFARAIPPAAANGWRRIAGTLRGLASGPLQRRGVQPVLLAVAVIAALVLVHGRLQGRLTSAVALAGGLALLAVLLAGLPVLFGFQTLSLRWVPQSLLAVKYRLQQVRLPEALQGNRTARIGGLAMASVLLMAGVAGAGWTLWRGTGYLAGLSGMPSVPGLSSRTIEGRARALSGDTIRIGSEVIRLAGIEAPERGQRCSRPGNRRWRCGDAARRALARSVSSGSIRCSVSGTDDTGRAVGTCVSRDKDIAEALVRGGHVFAVSGMFSAYASLEQEAQAEKRGIWRGEAERPSAYRARLAESRQRAWEQAKRTAPGGCPIKGQVVSGRKYYVLPGSDNYARIRIRSNRGERWFCSEQEASAAGWKLSPRS